MSRERPEMFDDDKGKKVKREADVAAAVLVENTGGRRLRQTMLGPPGTLNTVTPCAACKLLRRRCAQECPFSPYFSPHEPQRFASVHKVFGASNVAKLLMEVPESQRADAANSLVYEANVRLRDPVYGCMGAISALHQQIQSLQAELNAVRAEILKYKYREASNNNINSQVQSNHHVAALISSGAISVAAPPPTPPTPPEVAQPPPPPSQSDHRPSSSSSSSSMYTQPSSSTAADYSTNNVSNENVSSYFG